MPLKHPPMDTAPNIAAALPQLAESCVIMVVAAIPSPNPNPLPSTPKTRIYRTLPICRMRCFLAARSSRERIKTGIPNARSKRAQTAIQAAATATPIATEITNSSTVGFHSKPDAERHSQLALAGCYTQNSCRGILSAIVILRWSAGESAETNRSCCVRVQEPFRFRGLRWLYCTVRITTPELVTW
jgi:hypothetical protein